MNHFDSLTPVQATCARERRDAVKAAMLLAAAVLHIPGIVQAQDRYIIREQKMGSQKTTTIQRVTPPPIRGQAEMDGVTATSVVLTARDWRGGRCFTDELGRRWCLVFGVALDNQPEQLAGWIIRTEDG